MSEQQKETTLVEVVMSPEATLRVAEAIENGDFDDLNVIGMRLDHLPSENEKRDGAE